MKLLLLTDKANVRHVQKIRVVAAQHEWVTPKVAGISTLTTHAMTAKKMGVDAIVCCCKATLEKLVSKETGNPVTPGDKSVTLHNYKGSMYKIGDYPVVVLNNLSTIFTFTWGAMAQERYLNKLTQDTPTHTEPDFKYTPWELNKKFIMRLVDESIMTAIDIETIKMPIEKDSLQALCEARGTTAQGMWADMKASKNSKHLTACIPTIDMVGYTFLLKRPDGELYSVSTTIPFDSQENLQAIRKINSSKAPKVLQNGGYDSTYFIRFGCPMYNWIYDTYHFMHCWYAELPRTLGFIGAMFLKKHKYWKDEISTNRMEYCAKDVHATLWSFIFMTKEAPSWVYLNYQTEFKKVFPNICAGLEGDKVDREEQHRLFTKYQDQLEAAEERLSAIAGGSFNANSPKQVKALMQTLTSIKITETDKVAMRRWADLHPINMYIAEAIKNVRESQKKISTYINATLFDGRLLYEINCGGTDTGRAASKASNLWTGTQRQNIDGKIKSMYIADDGYEYGACDGAQAESRTTAYISEDMNLINTVENAPDFHTRNAGMFFGRDETEVTKTLRTLGKRVNHGANYNMGANVLVETMGMKMVLEAKYLLGLPAIMSVKGTAEYLLDAFDRTYPLLRTKYYDEVIAEVLKTGALHIPCEEIHWKRLCFGKPTRQNKRDLNLYVAHMPQSLSAQMLDKAWFNFWYKWQIKENCVRCKAPVHDEIQFQIKVGHPRKEEIGLSLSAYMSEPVTVRGRTLSIPADVPIYGRTLADVKD